jgi:uncharacterized protein
MYAIDFHTHVFPDKLASAAVAYLSKAANTPSCGNGTLADLKSMMLQADVKKAVLVSIATRVSQVKSINNWLHQQKSDFFIPFAAVHPEDPDRFNEVERIAKLGFKGIKMHPNYQEFYPDETRIIEFARCIRDFGLILVIHAGKDLAFEEVNAAPARIAGLIESVPGLKLVVAHFGGFQRWEEAEKTLSGKDVYFDTSYTLSYINREDFYRIARKFGIDRLLFATDYPWSNAGEEIALLKSFDFSDQELSAILHGNAEKLLGIEAESG